MSSGSTVSQRLFIAISLPEPVRAAVTTLQTPSRHVRWTPVEQLHVTLRFLGDIEPEVYETLVKRLADVRVEPFVLPIESVGVFPQKGPPHVLWVPDIRGCINFENRSTTRCSRSASTWNSGRFIRTSRWADATSMPVQP